MEASVFACHNWSLGNVFVPFHLEENADLGIMKIDASSLRSPSPQSPYTQIGQRGVQWFSRSMITSLFVTALMVTSGVSCQAQALRNESGLLTYPSILNRFLKPPSITEATPPQTTMTADPSMTAANSSAVALISHEDLDATLWVRKAYEYKAITRQTYRAAMDQLPSLLNDRKRDALSPVSDAEVDADRDVSKLPPCVIMDVDETVLDNSGYQRSLILAGESYSSETWSAFVNQQSSPAIAGARAFVSLCRRYGVRVFFVTNREFSLEPATRANLVRVGLMRGDEPDQILSKGERQEWTSGKSIRRSVVASKFRVLMLFGDDLNDFLPVKGKPITERGTAAAAYESYWGRRWFMLPNPNYGSWENAVIDENYSAPDEDKRRIKMQKLQQP